MCYDKVKIYLMECKLTLSPRIKVVLDVVLCNKEGLIDNSAVKEPLGKSDSNLIELTLCLKVK